MPKSCGRRRRLDDAYHLIVDDSEIRTEAGPLNRLSIFPEEVVLSPGQFIRLSRLGFDGDGLPLSGLDVQWQLDPQVESITPPLCVTAAGPPGVYPEAIVAVVNAQAEVVTS